jgi:hypothetical protein
MQLGRAFDCPLDVVNRYNGAIPVPKTSVWSENAPVRSFLAGSDLRINLLQVSSIKWRTDESEEWRAQATRHELPGVHSAILPTGSLSAGKAVEFSWQPSGSGNTGEIYQLVAAKY